VKLAGLARFSSVLGATVWVLGLPLVVASSVPFASDGTFFLFGLVSVLLGLAVMPIALTYPPRSPGWLISVVRGVGVMACVALVATGVLLVGGSTGLLGNRAPSWISGAPLVGLIGFFVWVLLASYSAHRSTTFGRWVFWLGILAAASVLVPIVISVLVFFLDPGFMDTNATIPLSLLSAVLTWWCLPIWLIALAARRSVTDRSGTSQPSAAA
jgi:hypothetical protein